MDLQKMIGSQDSDLRLHLYAMQEAQLGSVRGATYFSLSRTSSGACIGGGSGT